MKKQRTYKYNFQKKPDNKYNLFPKQIKSFDN